MKNLLFFDKFLLLERKVQIMKNTIIVNFFGAPGSGKSTLASELFAKLKKLDVDAELVSEFAKELVWDERSETFKDEIYIFAKQHHRLFRVNGKVDVIVTDRPLLLTCLYNNVYGSKSRNLDNLVSEEFNKYININYLIERDKKFNENGQNQNEESSNYLHIQLKQILDNNDIKYEMRKTSEFDIYEIANTIHNLVEKKTKKD